MHPRILAEICSLPAAEKCVKILDGSCDVQISPSRVVLPEIDQKAPHPGSVRAPRGTKGVYICCRFVLALKASYKECPEAWVHKLILEDAANLLENEFLDLSDVFEDLFSVIFFTDFALDFDLFQETSKL